jgi:plasmid stability protein
MSVMIRLRHVPDGLHRRLKSRAALAGMSMSDYLLKDIARLAEQPTMEEWLEMVKKLRPMEISESSAGAIRALRDSR